MGYTPGMKRGLEELKTDLSLLAGMYIINLHIKIAREETLACLCFQFAADII